jgi:hypothetical protein
MPRVLAELRSTKEQIELICVHRYAMAAHRSFLPPGLMIVHWVIVVALPSEEITIQITRSCPYLTACPFPERRGLKSQRRSE